MTQNKKRTQVGSAQKEEIGQKLKKTNTVSLTGLPNPTSQAHYISKNQSLDDRVIFWLLKKEDLNNIQQNLYYWHKLFKHERIIWPLDEINPMKTISLAKNEPQIVLVDIAGINDKIPILNDHETHQLLLKKGIQFKPATLSQKLISMGYEFSSHASQSGCFARRGGIVEIYPVNTEFPVRLEFDDNSIISLHSYNPVNKKSTEKLDSIEIIANKFIGAGSRTQFMDFLKKIQNTLIIYQDNEEFKSMLPNWKEIKLQLNNFTRIIFEDFKQNAIDTNYQTADLYRQDYTTLVSDLKTMGKNNWRIYIATNKEKELQQLFAEKQLGKISIEYCSFIYQLNGFKNEKEKTILITDKEIFGEENIRRVSPHQRVDQAFMMELKEGDYVVHLDHGIGRFTGMRKHEIEGIEKEYFVVQYDEGDKISVPVEMADKLSKYIGVAHPKLHRLSGGHWYQLTRKVKQEAKVLAQELLKIYAKREMIKIKPFTKETPEEKELEKSFKYKETPDQAKAIAAVKHDLEKETPMDRLICGDVGFGKTEVAVRAAFKAAMNKKQVALLSPTTILTQQHYDTFKNRLEKFPVKIGILSRFESDKEQDDTIEKLKSGLIDIVIGTHRLLSSDVNFKNLGLIIIDEEQRFGVKAKEKLKAFRTQAHILTLTATPIPRTLNIALSGVRDVSIIETPPEGRLPINTVINQYSNEIVKKAVKFELERQGQIYFLHNKVETIHLAARELKKMIPKAKIGVAHGRLPEKELAQAMGDFDNRKTNLLVCSTIIENGLDLPNVNTMIVDNATNFGLAQLYQLRGRIGRGHRQAFSYFLFHRKKLKGNAKKRLQALMEAKKLGSGFQLALRDLEIRGAGNILGKEQHGKVSAIGLSLYTRLLAQAIEELKFGKVQEPIRDIIIDLPLPAFIPQEFLPEEERLLLYQKMAGITNVKDLNELKDKIIRSRTREEQLHFPQQITNLFEVLETKLLAQKTDISNIDTTLITDEFGHKKRRLIIKFLFPLKPEPLAKLIQKNQDWQFKDDLIKIDLDKLGKNWVQEIKKVINLFTNK